MPALTDYDLARVCYQLYNPPFATGYWGNLWDDEACYCAHKIVGDADIVVFRGSSDALDRFDDFDAVPVKDPVLGYVHQGFAEPVAGMLQTIDAVLKQPRLIVLGHSLGAARAWLFAAYYAATGKVPEVVVWGSPRPGYQKVADILSSAPARSYRNRTDPVTEVPPTLPNFPFVQPRALIAVDEMPSFLDMWGPLADHHMSLYLQGMARMYGTK